MGLFLFGQVKTLQGPTTTATKLHLQTGKAMGANRVSPQSLHSRKSTFTLAMAEGKTPVDVSAVVVFCVCVVCDTCLSNLT